MQMSATDFVPLSSLASGAEARIIEIRGGRGLARKLLALGLRVGSLLRVQHRRRRGVVVLSGATRIALGGGIADKVMVSILPSADTQGA